MAGAVQIEGLTELRAELRNAADGSPREVTKRLKEGAVKVTARAKELAPKDTGALAADLRPFATQKTAGVRGTLIYGPVQEWKRAYPGTPPRFAFRAVDELAPGLVEETFAALTEILKAHGWFVEV